MKQFHRLPSWLRISVVVVFFFAAVVIGIQGHPSAILSLASLALLVSGAWRLSRFRALILFLIMIPLLVAFVLAGFDWHHPFLARYSAGLFSVIAVLIFMDAVRIEEWIEVLHKNSQRFHLENVGPILIGTAVGIVSLAAGIQEQRACRKLAGVYRWRAKSRISLFLDSISLPFYSAVESHEFIDEALHRWGSRRRYEEAEGAISELEPRPAALNLGNSTFTARLIDLYDFPYFTDLVRSLSTSTLLDATWETKLSGLVAPSAALEINGRSEAFTRRLLQTGGTLTVAEGVRAYRKSLGALQLEYGSRLVITGDSSLKTLQNRFDCILFHQGAFLEAINEMQIGLLLKRLFALSTPRARIFFTYPELGTVGAEGTVFAGNLPEIGQISCQYSDYAREGETASARLSYTVKQEHDSYHVRVPIKFKAPDPSTILQAADDAGFLCKTFPIPQAVGFFLGDQVLIELRKR